VFEVTGVTKSKEYENFDHAVRELLKVPHKEIKEKLDAEKAAKKAKKPEKKNRGGSRNRP
jgi:hypothetical protein